MDDGDDGDDGAKVGGQVSVDRTVVREAVHALRNRMNSMLMNAGALAAYPERLPEPLQPFALQIQRDGQACSAALARLSALFEDPES